MKGKTASGFKFDIDVEKFKDWEFMEWMDQSRFGSDAEQINASINMVKFIFGADYRKFIDHIKTQNNGHAPVDKVIDELSAVLNACKETKK